MGPSALITVTTAASACRGGRHSSKAHSSPELQSSSAGVHTLQILRSHLVKSDDDDDDQVVAQRVAPSSEVAPPFSVAPLQASAQDCVVRTDSSFSIIPGAGLNTMQFRPLNVHCGNLMSYGDALQWQFPGADVTRPCAGSPLDLELSAAAAQPFDLFTAPLARFRMWGLGSTEHVFTVLCHHSILDGLSAELLQRELATAYAAAKVGRAPASDPLPVT